MDRFQAIRIFLRVVELGSFSKAAADLGIAQSSVTKNIVRLEQHLGARLLHRTSHDLVLTEVGAAYYEKSRVIWHHVAEADSVAALMNSRLEGSLRISTSVAFGGRVLGPLILEFMALYPTLQIDMELDDQHVNLIEKGVDLAVRLGRLPDSTLGARQVGTNPWALVASPECLARLPAIASPDDLVAANALIYSTTQGPGTWRFTDNAGREAAVNVKGTLRSNSLQTLLDGALAGLGVAALPRYLAEGAIVSGALVALLPAWRMPAQDIHAVYPSARMVPSKVSMFVNWLSGKLAGEWWRGEPTR